EQRRSVRGREQADLGRERADVRGAAPVDADALFDDALADDLFGVRTRRRTDLAFALGELGGELLCYGVGRLVQGRVALGLRGDRVRSLQAFRTHGDNPLVDVVAVVDEQGELDRLFRACFAHQLALELDRFADPGLGDLEPVGDHLFCDLRSALFEVLEGLLRAPGLHHDDGDI